MNRLNIILLKIKSKIYKILNSIRIRISIAIKEIKNIKENKQVSFYRKLFLFFKGFESNKEIIYQLKKKNINSYLSDYHRWKSREVNGKYNIIFDDKLISTAVLEGYVNVPENIALIEGGRIKSLKNSEEININQFLELIQKYEKLIFKPIIGGKGKGIFTISIDKNIYIFNKNPITYEELTKLILTSEKYIVSEYIKQHKYADKLFTDTTNTIRMITMKDPLNNEIFLPFAVQRIGTNKSIPVDNWSKGGMSASIDVVDGYINSPAASIDKINKINYHKIHPDNKSIISGIKIPHWNNIKHTIINTHEKLLSLHFIAWDVVVTQDSFSIIEINASTDVDLIQVHNAMLNDKRIIDFYKFHKILKKNFKLNILE